jgi:hypothetical protein
MQATYESSISCFDGKLLWLTTNILKKVVWVLENATSNGNKCNRNATLIVFDILMLVE